MLTPLDIHNKEFRKGLRGYNIIDVDEFLDEIIRDFEALYKENLDLKDKIQKQEENINQYKEIERALQNTLVLAQKISDEVKQNAQKEAELQIWEARKKGAQIVAQAENEITESIKRLEKLRNLERQMYVKIRGFLLTELDLVDNYDFGEDIEGELQKKVEEELSKKAEATPSEQAAVSTKGNDDQVKGKSKGKAKGKESLDDDSVDAEKNTQGDPVQDQSAATIE